MKRLPFTFFILMLFAYTAMGQNVGFNDNNSEPKASAMVDIYSASKGLLIPRVALTSTTSASPVTSPESSLLVYNTATVSDVTPGYYYWNSARWVRLVTNSDPRLHYNVVKKSADATLLKTENMIVANGDITITLPTVTVADNGLEICVKNIGTYTDLVIVKPQAGKKIDASDSSRLPRWRGRTYLAIDSNWVVQNKDPQPDNLLEVSSSGSFTTIAEVIAFLDDHISAPTVVRLGGGTHLIAETITIDFLYPVTFQGLSYGESTIEADAGVAGSPLFDCKTECYFKMLNFIAYDDTPGNDAIICSMPETYHEIKDAYFDGFNRGLVCESNNEVWVFETDFANCTAAGIEIAAGTAEGGSLKLSECDFTQCAIGIHLLSGVGQTISILNSTFYNTPSGTDIGLLYVPETYTSFSSMFITNNSWNNEGTYMSGFDFSLANGRDANAFVENNSGMESKNPYCKLTLLNNPITTAANGTSWVKANWNTSGTYLTTYTCKWDLTTTVNQLKYLPDNRSDVTMWISGNVSSSSANRTINIAICKNGVTTTRYGETTMRTATAGQQYQYSTVVYLEDVNPGDYFEIYFNSTAGVTDNITFSDINWWVSAN
jgi:hypothetical protein